MIERYIRDLSRALPLLAPRRRILAEVEDHLRAASRERGELEAVEAFGGRLFLGALVTATAALAAMAGLAAVLAVQWADAVPGTPSWLFGVNVVQLALTLAAVVLVARAARLSLR